LKSEYLHSAVLFTLSVAAAWTLTSIHRVYEIVHSDSPFGLNVISAIVIPLQGTFTASVFFFANWTTLRRKLADRKLVGAPPKRRMKPARQGKSVYSMWRDASPVSGRRDSWDFLDIGINGNRSSSQGASREMV
jgi:hypothetical protein